MANFALSTLVTLFWRNDSKNKRVYLYTRNWYTSLFETLTQIQFYEYSRMSKNKFEDIFQVSYLDTTNISKKVRESFWHFFHILGTRMSYAVSGNNLKFL